MLSDIDQFINYDKYEVIATPADQFLKCKNCSIEFFSKIDTELNGRYVKSTDDAIAGHVLCPVCASCFTRFFPSELIFEKLRKRKSLYSHVTIKSKKSFDFISISKTAYLIALLELGLDDYHNVTFSGNPTPVRIDIFIEKIKIRSVAYSRMMDLLLNETYFNEYLSEDFLNKGEGHFHLGEIISISSRDQKNISPEVLDKIGVYPSVNYIVDLVENYVISIDEIAKMIGIKLER